MRVKLPVSSLRPTWLDPLLSAAALTAFRLAQQKKAALEIFIFLYYFLYLFVVFFQIDHTQLGRHGEFSCLLFYQCDVYTNATNRKSKRFLAPRPRSRLRDPLSFDSPETSIPPSIHLNELVNTLGHSMLSSSSVCLRPRS